MKIPQCNPHAGYAALRKEIDAAVARVFDRGIYILGSEVCLFEKEFAKYIGVNHGSGTGSGTEALHLALAACGVGSGDEVITVSHTAVATVAAIELCGATPVLVDVNPETFTIDPKQAEAAITPKTKAIIPVHLYGHPADIAEILAAGQKHGIPVIEDCAQSHGASYGDRKTGAWGTCAAFSFYPTKNLGAFGDAGMVVTNDSTLAGKCRSLREYGWRERYISAEPGWNTRLDELQAAILRVKLPHLDKANMRRQEIARHYDHGLGAAVITPRTAKNRTHVYHQYVVRHADRDRLREYMATEKSIGTLVHYPVPIHLQPAYAGRVRVPFPLENTETIAREIVSLPMFPELQAGEIDDVIKAVKGFR